MRTDRAHCYLQGWLPAPNVRAVQLQVSQPCPPYKLLDILIGLPKQGGLAIQTPVSLLHQQVTCILNIANSTY